VLPKSSAEAGAWRSSRVPYLRAICQAAVDPKIKRVVMVMSSQSAKSECLLNIIGHRMDDDPAPVIMVLPTQRLAASLSQSRLMPMIRSTPGLAEKLDKRKSSNKATEKFIAGQRLGLAWSGSATELSSHPAALIVLDELDRMDSDTGGEGDPLTLAEARITTFPNGKIIAASTPTIEGASRIWSLYESGTQQVWTVACPDCLTYFAPSFDLLTWPPKSTPAQAKREARIACPSCGSLLEDKHRNTMNAAGKFEMRGDPDSDTASFWVSGLASPWRSWGDAAKAWVEAARSREPERMQAVRNVVFGELWKLQGEAPEAAKVQGLRGGYQTDEMPADARVITCGVDVQSNRLYFAVRAWGSKSESWLLRHGELFGETDQQTVWEDLAALLETEWGEKRIRVMLIDSGFRPDVVYAFSRRFPGRVLPSKGHDAGSKPVYLAKLDVNVRGEPQRRGVKLVHVDAGYFKSWVHGRIAWPQDQPGAWRLPIDAADDYCESLVAESRIVKANGKVIWVRSGQKRNDYLDCEALNAAAAHLLNVHQLRAVKRPAPAGDVAHAIQAPPPRPALAPRSRQQFPPRGNWTTNWR
jgi:phage terminase large subunit GpA-like protein